MIDFDSKNPSVNTLIRTAIQNNVQSANPFNISRLLSNQKEGAPADDKNGEDAKDVPTDETNGEDADYFPMSRRETITHRMLPASSLPPSHDGHTNSTSTKPKSKSNLRKKFSRGTKGVKSVVNNAFVTILMCVCLFGCLPHSSASAYEELDTYEYRPAMWVNSLSSSSTITVSRTTHSNKNAAGNSCIDAGANGCVGGRELRVISVTDRTVNVMGIDSHMLQSLPICTLAGVVDLPDGPVLCYFNQYAHHANGSTIHSKI